MKKTQGKNDHLDISRLNYYNIFHFVIIRNPKTTNPL